MDRKTVALAATSLMAVLAGCSEYPNNDVVSGLRDDVRFVAAHYATHTRPHYVNECKPKTRTKSSGSGKNKRTWTETYQDCTKVKQGTETYQDFDAAKWCVELDNLNGDPSDDDRWFTVNQGTYDLAAELAEGAEFKFTPIRQGC